MLHLPTRAGFLACVLASVLVLSAMSCSTNDSRPTASRTDGRPQARQLRDYFAKRGESRREMVARLGPPLAETPAGPDGAYRWLTYALPGEEDQMLLLFHGEDWLGTARATKRSVLEDTMRDHARVRSGRITLNQSNSEKGTVFFMADRSQVSSSPKWVPSQGGKPPLSQEQALEKVTQWKQHHAPQLSGTPQVLRMIEHPGIKHLSYYCVLLGDFTAPLLLREVLVLMDGTVIQGELP